MKSKKRIAINGFGRIGRNILRAFYERKNEAFPFEIVAINDLGNAEVNAHLLVHDTVHGRFNRSVLATSKELIVAGDSIHYSSERDIASLEWSALGIDLVLECTGLFTTRELAKQHISSGAKRVLISAPGTDVDATIVYGVNHRSLNASHKILSNASCTTNCLAPIVDVLERTIGIESGLITTVHAFTSDQVLTDSYHSDPRRARAASQSMIPTKTGAAAAIGEVIPALRGKLDGLAVRVPVINTSLLDLTAVLKQEVSSEQVNQILKDAAFGSLLGVMGFNELPLVSQDFNHNSRSSIVDATQTRMLGRQLKLLAWYDNEWGFANRMLDTAAVIANLDSQCQFSDGHLSDSLEVEPASCRSAAESFVA